MKKGRLLANAYLVLVFGFLYVPIAVLIAFSFNESKSRTVFTGFTFKWYQNLFHNDMVLKSLGVSLGVAFAAACIATVVGTLAAIGISSMNKRARGAVMAVSYVPVVTYSIDDFIISYFTSGTMQTLPIAIYSMTKKKVSPEINALSAIMFVVILTIILAANAVDSAKERRLRRAARAEEGRR